MNEVVAGAIFVACLGLGFSIGFVSGHVEFWGAAGLGAGLISVFILRKSDKYR
ncbi:hypothetical protein [Oceanobacillus massiliensis]|uniref:hypothetical protein n=1 Tax=Oceanobacillus massiliensis TaxID=1465765 RepID=UPI000302B322|nr:hypothetical protein [Oceanobacillus massiliensis]